jgi:LacI family transcriptional regulator
MSEIEVRRRATVHDVAASAGVSLATVDRVLNGRPGVRPATIEKVEIAIAALGFQRDLSASLLARARDLQVVFLIPARSNAFMASLSEAVDNLAARALADRVRLEARHFPVLDAEALAAEIDGLDPRQCDCAVIVASEDAPVFAAVERAHRRGITVMTLVSDLPGSARRHFIGIDNLAAGRTAASLLGRFCRRGPVGVIAGSMHLRDHRERFEGFRAVIEKDFPDITVIGPIEGHETNEETEDKARRLLADHGDLAGLYNLGAGNGGLVTALGASGRAGALHVVVHELSAPTRSALLEGVVDVVLDQNPDREIAAALAAARQLVLGGNGAPESQPIDIGIFLRDNLR